MAVVIHCDPQLHKCLHKLRRAGGRALLAAEQVETILARLASCTGRRPGEVHKHTRRGEARIEHCKKFDLVGGYRLVYIQKAQQYYFLFAGTHDDCDRWLTHHRDLVLEMPGVPTPAEATPMAEVTSAAEHAVPPDDLDYDAIVLKDIDEKTLRRVFRGLCGA
jgi:short subunit dehydrogenase-like uncharacterized protein